MIDFHCHLDLYPNPEGVADEAQRRGIGVLSVTTTPSAWPGTSRLGQARPAIKTAIGFHPQLASERRHELRIFDRYLRETHFVGEVGLDGSPEFKGTWALQLYVFEHILEACSSAGDKIVSIHSRRAATSVLDFLDIFTAIYPILHWFSGNKAELDRAIARRCWFSVGPAMLAGAKGRSLVAAMPRDRVVLETDGPFAQVHRTPLNPWDVALASRALAETWRLDVATTEQILRRNEWALLGGEGVSTPELPLWLPT